MYELKFYYQLSDYSKYEKFRNHGPKFTQYLPNGKKDAIKIELDKIQGEMTLWFDRQGKIDKDGYIIYDTSIIEVDNNTLNKQGVLDAGVLKGEIIVDENLNSNLIEKIKSKIKNDPEYIKLGKILVKEILKNIKKLTTILKYQYGQYWLVDIKDWDSRVYPLGVFCEYHLQLSIKFDNGIEWYSFIPDDETQILRMTSKIKRKFPEYITEEDWSYIRDNFNEINIDSPINEVILLSYEYYKNDDNKTAVIFGCTALELAVDKYFDGYKSDYELSKDFGSFYNLPLKTKLMTIFRPNIDIEKVKKLINIVLLRNKIVHEGFIPSDIEEEDFKEFLKIISLDLLNKEIKLPDLNHGNFLNK